MKKHYLIDKVYRVFRWNNRVSLRPEDYSPPAGWKAIPALFTKHPVTQKLLSGQEYWIIEVKRGGLV